MKTFLKTLIAIYKQFPFLSYLWNKLPNKLLLPVTVGDTTIRVYKGHWAAIASGTYEPETLKTFDELIEEGLHFLDVGANVGLFSNIAASRGAKVSSFEPHPEIRNVLERNLRDLQANIYNFAASDLEEEVKLYLSDEPGSHSLNMKHAEYVQVQAVQLDNVIKENVHLIKIDVEGAEVKALKGMHNILLKNKPTLIIEVDEEHLNRFGEDFNSLKTLLEQYGYKGQRISNENNYLFR